MKRGRLLAALLLVFSTGLALAAQFRIEVAVDLVSLYFSATDSRGRMISGLTADDFVVEEDGKKQEIALFSRDRDQPLTLALLLDISPSVAPVFGEEKQTAAGFLQSVLGPRDLALVIAFNRHVILTQDFSEDPAVLSRAIQNLERFSDGTSLYDAVYLASNDKLSREAGRKAIVVISDGEDTTSKYKLGDALIATQRNNVIVYAISNSGSPGNLRTMAEDTGGGFFRVKRAEDFKEVFDQISVELRTQYSLGYRSTNTVRDGKFRRIRIIPKDPKIDVRVRRGYYAPQTP